MMYANLRVKSDGLIEHSQAAKWRREAGAALLEEGDDTVYAWHVETNAAGDLRICTDLADGSGSYVEEGPVIVLKKGTPVSVAVSF